MTDGPVPPGVDLDALRAWMDAHDLGTGPPTRVEQLTGGTQNVLVRFDRGGRSFVLRRPPLHKRRNSDETMRREARVLGALAGSAVPHPGLIAAEPDLDVLGAAFYLMEPITGFNPASGLPEPHRSDPVVRRAMGFSMMDAIAALASVNHEAVGLGDFGRPDGWLERQVGRWPGQLDGYAELDGYPGSDGGGVGSGITDLPAKQELVGRYADRTGRSVDDVDWYHVLAAYRLGIILEGTHARAFAGKAPKEVGDLLHATTIGLFQRALGVINAK